LILEIFACILNFLLIEVIFLRKGNLLLESINSDFLLAVRGCVTGDSRCVLLLWQVFVWWGCDRQSFVEKGVWQVLAGVFCLSGLT